MIVNSDGDGDSSWVFFLFGSKIIYCIPCGSVTLHV